MQFLLAANWLRTLLSRKAEIVEPLRIMLEERMQGATRRTARVGNNREIPDSARTDNRVLARNTAQDFIAHAVTRSNHRSDVVVLMFASHSR